MSKPIDPVRPAPASRAPKSGRKYIDPTKYQMDTVPTELVAKIAQMRLEPRPKEVLHPPPLFDERPIIGRLRRLGVWIARRRTWLVSGCLVGLCGVATMVVWQRGASVGTRGAHENRSMRTIGERAKGPAFGRAAVVNLPASPESSVTSSAPVPTNSVAETQPTTKAIAERKAPRKAAASELLGPKPNTVASAKGTTAKPPRTPTGSDGLFMKDYP